MKNYAKGKVIQSREAGAVNDVYEERTGRGIWSKLRFTLCFPSCTLEIKTDGYHFVTT
jgi:hypothetical protein